MRDASAEFAIALRMAEEVDDLGQLSLRLVDSRDVCERDLVTRRLIALGARAAERTQHVLDVACAAIEPEQQEHEEDRRAESEEEVLPPGCACVEGLRVYRHMPVLQEVREPRCVRKC